jgi:hypothetical protein
LITITRVWRKNYQRREENRIWVEEALAYRVEEDS